VAARQISEKTKTRYLVSLKQCGPFLEDKILDRIDAASLREMIKARREQGTSNATIRRDLTAVSAVLAHAQDEGWIEQNAALAVNRRRIPERRSPILLPTDVSIAAMLAAVPPKLADIKVSLLRPGCVRMRLCNSTGAASVLLGAWRRSIRRRAASSAQSL
jgi:integrase/recombinase XerD